MLYSNAAIFVLVPKWDANRGVPPVGIVGREEGVGISRELSAHERLTPA